MLIQKTFFIALGLTMAAWVGQSLRFTRLMMQCGLSSWGFLKIAIYLFPDLLLLTLPIGFALSVGTVYQQLHMSCQLVVARAVGWSAAAIARPVLLLGAGIIGILYATNSYLSPAAIRYFRETEMLLLRKIQILSAAEGEQVIDHEGFFVFARQKDKEGNLSDIVMRDQHVPETLRSIYAKRGRLVQQGDQILLFLEEGQRIDFDKKTQRITTILFDKYEACLSKLINSKAGMTFLAGDRVPKPHELFFNELFPTPGTVDAGRLDQLHAEAHQRLVSPLLVLVFALIGVLIVLQSGGQRDASSKNTVWTVFWVAMIECLHLGLMSFSGRYPALNFVSYGFVGGLLAFLSARLLWGRF
jgi:lipopolysaccharide export system permease protein